MLKNDLMLKNPLRWIGSPNEDILDSGHFGGVMARAGVGKTAFIVQIALNGLLRNRNVLHISLADPVQKVTVWYEEVFRNIGAQYDSIEMNQLWDTLIPHRFIMTFQVEGFSVPKLEERLNDLMTQAIFMPQMILIDGLPFDDPPAKALQQIKALAAKLGVYVWFTVRTHRHESPDTDGLPVQLTSISDMFELLIQLQPDGKQIDVRVLKGAPPAAERPRLMLDPATMLVEASQ